MRISSGTGPTLVGHPRSTRDGESLSGSAPTSGGLRVGFTPPSRLHSYPPDEEARRLAAEAGVANRIDRRQVDIAVSPGKVGRADLVVLHRVVCCYPDYQRLLRAAADRCRGRLVFSYPPRNLVVRGFSALQNGAFSMLGREYRSFVHSPPAMVATVEAAGMRHIMGHRGVAWQLTGVAR